MNRNEKTVMGILLLTVVCLGMLNVYQVVNPPPKHGVFVEIQMVFLGNMTFYIKEFSYRTGGELGSNALSHWLNLTGHIYTTEFEGTTIYFTDIGFGIEPVNFTHVHSY
jgi:hypothetical protein